jgi:hypothetical protein
VTVEALRLDQSDLNTKRMLELMAFDRAQPLYAQVIQRILRDMRLQQQEHSESFNYLNFLNLLKQEQLSPDQKRGLGQRLDTLQSFMIEGQVNRSMTGRRALQRGTDWTPTVRIRRYHRVFVDTSNTNRDSIAGRVNHR